MSSKFQQPGQPCGTLRFKLMNLTRIIASGALGISSQPLDNHSQADGSFSRHEPGHLPPEVILVLRIRTTPSRRSRPLNLGIVSIKGKAKHQRPCLAISKARWHNHYFPFSTLSRVDRLGHHQEPISTTPPRRQNTTAVLKWSL